MKNTKDEIFISDNKQQYDIENNIIQRTFKQRYAILIFFEILCLCKKSWIISLEIVYSLLNKQCLFIPKKFLAYKLISLKRENSG